MKVLPISFLVLSILFPSYIFAPIVLFPHFLLVIIYVIAGLGLYSTFPLDKGDRVCATPAIMLIVLGDTGSISTSDWPRPP
jgi:hypothetical protein